MESPDDSDVVAEAFDQLTRRASSDPKSWSNAEKAVWYIVTARTQKDMGGIDLIGEHAVSAAWTEACERLEQIGFLKGGSWTGTHPPPSKTVLERPDHSIGDSLWDVDPKLAALLRAKNRALPPPSMRATGAFLRNLDYPHAPWPA